MLLFCVVSAHRFPTCSKDSLADSILGFRDFHCPVSSGLESLDVAAVIEVSSLIFYFKFNFLPRP